MSNGSNRVNTFKNIIQSGPNFVCIVCNRCLYRKSVTLFSETQRKELLSDLFNFICSNDNKFYICKAFAKIVSKNPISCQAAFKKLKIYY